MKKIFIIVLCVINGLITSAQNNAIFQGGSGDGVNRLSFAQAGNDIFTGGSGSGWIKTSFAQTANNIFTGGSGDGWNNTTFIQAANNIFTGGSGDGWNSTSFLQAGNNIFTGGDGDGWNSTSFLQTGNSIFNGGNGDGWNAVSFLQAGNNIFTGGVGDGWSSTYRPMGPIPVTFVYFNAQKQGQMASLLNWKTSQEINSAYFNVERSSDAVNFNYIGRVSAAGNSQLPIEYYFTDNYPASGLNYYRLKQIDIDGHFTYTPSRLVRFDGSDAGVVKYFPNPTNGILNIELTTSMKKEAKVVNITNAAAVVMNQFKLGINTDQFIQIDLGRYPKGVYFIQVKTETVNSTQRVVLQ